MQKLTPEGQNFVQNICSRYNLSFDAVIHMLGAVNQGGGSMAQFNCPELGGGGQWMRGGMTMVGDMFNSGLKNTVDSLCNELAQGLSSMTIFPVIPAGAPGSSIWWPQDLGQPFSSGAQNNTKYAVFPGRLAILLNGSVSVYDTLNHQIGGVSQQQGGNDSLTFSSQFGTIPVSSLPLISGPGLAPAPNNNFAAPAPVEQNPPAPQVQEQVAPPVSNNSSQSSSEIMALLEKLGQLQQAGVLTDDEFSRKKSELLSRL